ncbi:MAG: CotH kinase family protein [Bacteroidota bacterium]|nr:CotH kinase family protein [Bacteroidota bacterium]
MKKPLFFISLLFICVFIKNSNSQVLINEITNANVSDFLDENDENDENESWIELYNTGSTAINLLNYSISDKPEEPQRWIFPEVTIEANSFVVVFASGNNIKDGNSLHTNFKIKAKGEKITLSNDKGHIIDQYDLGYLQMNHSVGRKPDGGSWCLFDKSTLGATNNNSACYDGYEADPIFSLDAGFYSSSQNIELYSPSETGILRYTLDGKIPSSSSTIYSSPISANKTIVLSAKCFSSKNKLPSMPVKKTFFIDDDNKDVVVISITMDPDDMFDPEKGIYVNYEQDWERECHIEYFDKQKVKQFEIGAGIKIQGNYSKHKAQKSFRILTRKQYGTAWLEYPLFQGKPNVTKFKRFNIRNGGSDYNYTRFRDAFMQRVLKDSPVDRMEQEPALIFLNGEYWGHYELREQQNTKHLLTNYGIPEDQVDFLYHKGSKVRAAAGSDKEFYTMHEFITMADPQTPDFYNSCNERLDLENFTDYLIAGIYYFNPDWIDHTAPANNIRLYREHKPGGKWRYMYWDLDMGMGLYNRTADTNALAMVHNPREDNVHSQIFRNLLKNTQFKNYFVNRYADLMNTAFQHDNLKTIAYKFRDEIDSAIPRHKERWGGIYDKWKVDVDKMIDWNFVRIEVARKNLNNEFNLKEQVNVTLQTSPSDAGRIIINTIVPDGLPWSGVYFNGVPVTITAIANPGFTFDYWGTNGSISSPDYNEAVTLNINSDDTFTAYFKGSAVDPKLTFSEINYHSEPSRDAGDWFELHNYDNIAVNLTGWFIRDSKNSNEYKIPFGTVIPPNGYLVFSCDTLKFKSQFPFLTGVIGQLPFNLNNKSDAIKLYKYDKSLYLSVTYSGSLPWPVQANGQGRTLELKDPIVSLDLGTNWFAGCNGGSPGLAYNTQCSTNIENQFTDGPFNLKVWPNPSSDIITINIISSKENLRDMSFAMYDFTGNEVKKISSITNGQLILNRNEFSPGIYIIKIGNGESFDTEKIIFQ